MAPGRRHPGVVLAVGLLGLLGLLGCGTERLDEAADDDDLLPASAERTATRPIDGAVADRVDLDGLEVWVGATADAGGTRTDRLLAAVTVQALRAAGAEVRHTGDLGGAAARDALLSGEIDLYWEGVGDAWTLLLRQPADGLSGEEIHGRLAERDLEENGIAWLGATEIDDGPRFAEAAEPEEGARVRTMSAMGELLASNAGEESDVCVTGTFTVYPEDGQVAVEEALDLEFDPEHLRTWEPEPIYPDTQDGTCRFGLVESTSGRIAQYELAVLVDDVGAFLPNPLAAAMREDVLVDHPEVARVVNAIAERLDASELREMHRRILVEDAEVGTVARAWLASEGLVPAGPG